MSENNNSLFSHGPTNQSKKQTEEVDRIESEKSRYEFRKHFKEPVERAYDAGNGGKSNGKDPPESRQTQTPDNFDGAVKEFVAKIPKSSELITDDSAFYIQFDTNAAGLLIPEKVKQGYPDEVLIVLHHQFKDLNVKANHFYVTIWFSGNETTIKVPFKAVNLIENSSSKLRRKNT